MFFRTILLTQHSDLVVLAALGVLFHTGVSGPSKVSVFQLADPPELKSPATFFESFWLSLTTYNKYCYLFLLDLILVI